jgi:hypothetical protein
LINYHELDKADRHGNTHLAFQIAADHLGIPQLLEVEDLCDKGQPDERSVMTYIASFFHAFSSQGWGRNPVPFILGCAKLNLIDQAETVSRRVEKFADLMYTIWVSRNDYERRCRLVKLVPYTWNTLLNTFTQLLELIAGMKIEWTTVKFTSSYVDAKAHAASLQTYKQTKKREWVTEKQDLATLFSNVQTKLKTYQLREWKPDPKLTPSVGRHAFHLDCF